MAESRDDDDVLTGPVPGPDAEPTAAERAHAKAFADLVDKTLAGRTPPAMTTDDRALLEVATVIRAGSGDVELAPARRRAIVEDALAHAIGETAPAGAAAAPRVVPRWRRVLPWAIAGGSALAAAATALLWLRAPVEPAEVAAPLPASLRSRPADAIVGRIAPEQAGAAGERIDAIFADRLDGYRELRFGRTP